MVWVIRGRLVGTLRGQQCLPIAPLPPLPPAPASPGSLDKHAVAGAVVVHHALAARPHHRAALELQWGWVQGGGWFQAEGHMLGQ